MELEEALLKRVYRVKCPARDDASNLEAEEL
jgi:hypothetical protein